MSEDNCWELPDQLGQIINSQTDDLLELLKIAGLNLAFDLAGANLCSLHGADLHGVDFNALTSEVPTSAILTSAVLI